MNGQEGKVILKAIIRSDGQAEVSFHKSSGYSVLDEAAMEAVKRACPIDMAHALGKPQVVVSLPMLYSLAKLVHRVKLTITVDMAWVWHSQESIALVRHISKDMK